MKRFWNRAGWFGMAVCALLTSLVLQIVMGIVAMLPAGFLAGMEAGMQGITDIAEIEAMVMDKTMEMVPWGVFLYHILSLPVFALWYYFGCGRPKAKRLFRVLNVKCILIVLVVGFGLNLLANGLAMIMQFLAPAIYAQYVALMETAGMGESLVTIIASVLLAPIGEELLCRGIIMHCGRRMTAGIGSRRTAFWLANIIQALFFGIMHGNLIQGTYAFVLGLGLGLLCERYNSLYPVMLCHFVINALSLFVMGHLFSWVPETLISAIIVTLVGAVISVMILKLSYVKSDSQSC